MLYRFNTLSVFAPIVAILLSALSALTAYAQQVSVTPVRVDFATGKTTASVTIGNNTERTLTLQPGAVTWQQVNGEEKQEPTRDILTAPPLVEIAPGAQQVIRVSLRATAQAHREVSYRLIMREVPSSDKDGNQSGVKFLLNLSLPVFIAPTTAKPEAKLSATATFRAAGKGKGAPPAALVLAFRNAGSAHSQVTEVKMSDGNAVKMMFYVLPGGERNVELPWPASAAPAATMPVALVTSRGPVTLDVPVQRIP
jgi:fimbrial chaperone protein